ncbi:chain length-determining protein [Glaciimonas sp. CA11.2]|uniref:XrtA system polysaccharide chain length determinant n=2 Tax=Glaciimonas sp. CA11.2 TaxID=3048601 RepID=UPI002AB58B48|nr:XrtA system polysaccharide chain length determinant [Glaciimonas sp. CA11.2]MDY7544692.1 chain length-determining protein [Glaciimonas sp. CA11.2]
MLDLIPRLLSFSVVIWKYKWYATSIAWLVFLVGGGVIYGLPNDFQASARVYVDTQSILKPLLSGMTSVPNVEQQVSIMSHTLLSRPNLERVMRMTDLDIKAKNIDDKEKLTDELATQIKITQTGRDDIYTITYNNQNPKLGKDVVQSLLTIFVEGSVGDKKQDSDKAVRFIEEQIKGYEDKLNAAENAVKEFKQKNAGLLPRQGSDYETQLQLSADALSLAQLDLKEAEQARNAIKRQVSGEAPGGNQENDPAIVLNPQMDARIQLLTKRLDDLRMQFTEQYPDVIATKRLIAELETRRAEEARTGKRGIDPGANYSPMLQQLSVALSAAEAKVASMRARTGEYAARYARLKAQNGAAPDIDAQFAQLNRDYQINKENYEKLVGRRDAAKLSGDLSSATDLLTFRVIDPPTVPILPVGPNRLKLFSILFVAALAAGVGLTLLISQIRPTFLSQSELLEATGIPVLGAVTMNWTVDESARRKKSAIGFSASFAGFIILYFGVMLVLLFKAHG